MLYWVSFAKNLGIQLDRGVVAQRDTPSGEKVIKRRRRSEKTK